MLRGGGGGGGALGSIQQVIDHHPLGSPKIAARRRPAAHIHSNPPPPQGLSPLLFPTALVEWVISQAPLRAAGDPTQLCVAGHFIPYIVCLINLLPPPPGRGGSVIQRQSVYIFSAVARRIERGKDGALKGATVHRHSGASG